MITTSTGAKKIEGTDDWRDIFDDHNDTVDAYDQVLSGKADKSATVSTVAYDTSNKKITKTINGTTTDVVSVSGIKSDLGSFTWGALAGQ